MEFLNQINSLGFSNVMYYMVSKGNVSSCQGSVKDEHFPTERGLLANKA